MRIKYLQDSAQNDIYLSEKMLSHYDTIPEKLVLHIGLWKKEITVHLIKEFPEDTIGFSKNLTDKFVLPETFDYEIRLSAKDLFIGPVVAYLSLYQTDKLLNSPMEALQIYYSENQNTNGLIYLCSPDGINNNNKTIEGYYYNINANGQEDKFVKGVFPYPGVMYKGIALASYDFENIKSQMENRIFNSCIFDKWDMWRFLSPYMEIKEYLPHTEMFVDFSTLDNMLNLYNQVFLKLSFGAYSIGLTKIEKRNDKYYLSHHLEDETIFNSKNELSNYINIFTNKKMYTSYQSQFSSNKILSRFIAEQLDKNVFFIIQQAINAETYEDRKVDFRIILQKNQTGTWICTGSIARFGDKKCITSECSNKGYAKPAIDGLKAAYKMNDYEASKKLLNIIEICITACKTLDNNFGSLSDVEIDVILDKNLKAWILEINNELYDHKFPLLALKDSEMYHRAVINPFEYAKSISF